LFDAIFRSIGPKLNELGQNTEKCGTPTLVAPKIYPKITYYAASDASLNETIVVVIDTVNYYCCYYLRDITFHYLQTLTRHDTDIFDRLHSLNGLNPQQIQSKFKDSADGTGECQSSSLDLVAFFILYIVAFVPPTERFR